MTDLLIRRLTDPPFGTETSERNLMAEAARSLIAAHAEIDRLRAQHAAEALAVHVQMTRADRLAADNARLAAQVQALTGAATLAMSDLEMAFKPHTSTIELIRLGTGACLRLRAALEAAEVASWPKHMQDTFRAVMGQRASLGVVAAKQVADKTFLEFVRFCTTAQSLHEVQTKAASLLEKR